MALIHSKQFNPRFTGSFSLSGSFGGSKATASFSKYIGDGSGLTGITSVTTASIQNLNAGIVSGSSQIVSISDNAPSNPVQGDLWWKSNDGNLYVYYDGYWVISIDTTTIIPDGTISGSTQVFTAVTSSGDISGSGTGSFGILSIGGGTFTSASLAAGGAAASTTYNGNRRILQTRFPTLFSASFNPGTSGSISDFLDAVFYPNTAPSVSSSRFTLDEFVSPNVNVGTINATDAEALSGEISFATQSGYTDGFFTIHSGSGLIKTNTSTSASFNTVNRGDGVFAHPFLIEVSDTITTSQATIFIRVTPNTAPKFRTTSIAGSEIVAQTGSVNENTTNGTQILEFFVTDSESDTITISPLSQSLDKFSMATANVAGGKRIRISTNTSSFEFDAPNDEREHRLFVSASDEHNGNTSGSFLTTLPILVNVTDNIAPTMASQVFSMSESSGSHSNHGQGASTNSLTTVGTITTNDTEGDTVTFTGLTLASGSGGGNTNQSDPSDDPFQVASNGTLQLKAGQFLNSDMTNQYQYRATYKDNFNDASSSGVITINISDDPIPTLTNNAGTTYNGDDLFYIIESATNGDAIRVSSNGRTGTQGDFNSNETVYFTTTGSPYISINNSNGNLSVGTNISGSVFNFDNTSYITGSVTASNNFGTSTSSKFAVKVQINNAPVPSFSDSTANGFLNTNEARANTNNLSTITFTDTESNSLDHNTFVFTDPSGQLTTVKSGDSYFVRAQNTLSSSTYQMTASIKDTHGFRTGTTTNTFTIAAVHIGTLTGDTTGYILESATSGDTIRTNTLGFGGSAADLDVSYTNGVNYGNQSVQTFTVFENDKTTPHQFITSSAVGALSLKSNISESVFVGGTNLTASVVFQDQYQNVGSGSIVVNITKNSSPTSSFTNNTTFLNSNEARPGNKLLTISFSDAESDTLDHDTFVFTDPSGQLQTTKVGNTYEVFPRNNLSGSVSSGGARTYEITSSIKDEHGFSTGTRQHTFTIASGDLGTLGGNTNSYIIESATSGSLIRVNTNGRTGTQSDLDVSYANAGYGSPSVIRFTVFENDKTTPHQFITSSAAGALSIKSNVSESAYTFTRGTAMTASVVFEDQYQNIGSGSITVNIAKNNPPVITLSPNSQTLPSEKAVSGSFICSASFSDTESDTINFGSFGFGGTNGNLFSASRSGDAMIVTANQDISASTAQYSFNCTVKDEHGFHTSNATSATLNVQPMIYFYKSTNNTLGAFGSVADGFGNFGDPGNDETDYISGSYLAHFRSGSLNNTIGSSTIFIDHYYYSATTLDSKDGFNNHPGSATLIASQSSYKLSQDGGTSVWRQFGQIDLTGNNSRGHTWFVLFPSSSAIAQKPGTMGTEMTSPYPDHEYVVWSDNAASDTVESAGLMYFSLNDGVEINGANRWGLIFGVGGNNSTQYYHLLTSSGSSPSSEM